MGKSPPATMKRSLQVVVIELFGSILPATTALKEGGISAVFSSSEIASDPIEVASAHWPKAVQIGDVRCLKLEWMDKVVADNPDSLLWLTGGVPCKDVSLLNAHRQGASGNHSDLYEVVLSSSTASRDSHRE